jgi:hypothetical protein
MTQMIAVPNELYEKLQRSAQQRGIEVVDYLERLIEQENKSSSSPMTSRITPENQALYDEVMALRERIAQDMTGPVDIDQWIREDRER